MAGGLAAWLGYTETELDPAVQAEVLIESARAEARIAIVEILLAVGFGAFLGMATPAFRAVAWFAVLTVLPLLVDAAIRRQAARILDGMGPRPPPGVR